MLSGPVAGFLASPVALLLFAASQKHFDGNPIP
jgi:hypothetical protein